MLPASQGESMPKRSRAAACTCVALAALGLACAAAQQEAPAAPAVPAAHAAPISRAERIRASTGAIDDARLRAADADVGNWLTHGRTYAEQRYSPLDQIRAENVAQLGLAWSLDLGTTRGVEATPIAVDGVLFATGPWSVVYAIDARRGELIWSHDPQVPRSVGANACCDVVNRGTAVYKGRVYSGTLDGRLLALDAATGAVVWQVQTTDTSRPYTITGAPRIVAGNVILGNGGAEFGVRGYVSAYDAETGTLVWRFYTVPGDPAEPFESPHLAMAAATWSGEWWKIGGGATAWDSFAYDPELDLLYIGTGNGSPWSRYARSPEGGDNLFVSSILAVRPKTGELVWYFQTTPGDNWDYTSTQHMILADVEIGGQPRKVLWQAPKNGFFYAIDRVTGEFISGAPYVEVSWAQGLDANGRPIEADGLDYRRETKEIRPSPFGGHNWQPMSYHPGTGLVYVPAQEVPFFFRFDPNWRYDPAAWNTFTDSTVTQEVPPELVSGHLLAWDPRGQREVWRAQYGLPWNGGTLATAGNLVFQGTADGRFVAYRANDGAKLWESPAGTGVVAAPITYLVDGVQHVTVMAGWGGVFALAGGDAARAAGVRSVGRALTWRIGGSLPPPPPADLPPPPQPSIELDSTPVQIQAGGDTFHRWCHTCHGIGAVGGGVLPDLRYATPETHARLVDIVLGGAYQDRGMPSFARWLTPKDVEDIRAYVVSRARDAAEAAGLP
jgi:PQQ-dependent dehydrogenase (methanol/ethanol family)